MIELSQLTVLVAGEVLVGLLVLSGILTAVVLLRKGRIRKAAHQLAGRVQGDKPLRTERLKKLLSDRYGYGGNELEQTLHNISQAEMQLYQNIINGFLKDDQVYLQQLDVDVENLVLAYQLLKMPDGAAARVRDESPAGDDGELQRLQDENARLSEELKVTMDTMGRMLNEYSSMFSGGTGETYEPKDASEQVENESAETDAPVEDPMLADAAVWGALQDGGDIEIDIPEYSAEEAMSREPQSRRQSPSEVEEDAANAVDDEVSEIIDEVMGIADEMQQDEEMIESDEARPAPPSESLMDDLEKVDIELPDVDTDTQETTQAEPGSLEEEWAKLLEEDAASKADGKGNE